MIEFSQKRRKKRGFFWLAVAVVVVVVIAALIDDDDNYSSNQAPKSNLGTNVTNVQAAANSNQGFSAAQNFASTLSSQQFLDQLFIKGDHPMSKLYLPNYAYNQSLVYAEGDVNIFGQVRVLGGVVSKGRTQLGYGAMVTAVPEYVTRRATPSQSRYHITEWKEL